MRIDFDKLKQLLLPALLRGSEVLSAMVAAVLQPLKNTYATVLQYIDKERKERSYNSQVANLRLAVADLVGVDISKVQIYDVEDIEPLYIHSAAWDRKVYIGNTAVYIYSENTIRYRKAFIVEVPTQYRSRDAEIKAILDRYKLVTTRYEIKYI